MKSFSERRGLKKIRTEFQVDSMDSALQNRLWNVLDYFCWNACPTEYNWITSFGQSLLNKLWHSYFKIPVDTINRHWSPNYEYIRNYFFHCQWYEIYDFLEFIADAILDEDTSVKFKETCNTVFESELSAYRFVGRQISQLTSKEEISEVEQALEVPLETVRTHIDNALKLMSDRKTPDYRNSIKESISAVEAICRAITKNEKATLGQALNEVGDKIDLHQALKKGFSNLYGYTSSADGIRHALLDEPKLSFDDAKFMLVSCSAFVNYLVSKVSKAGISLD